MAQEELVLRCSGENWWEREHRGHWGKVTELQFAGDAALVGSESLKEEIERVARLLEPYT